MLSFVFRAKPVFFSLAKLVYVQIILLLQLKKNHVFKITNSRKPYSKSYGQNAPRFDFLHIVSSFHPPYISFFYITKVANLRILREAQERNHPAI